MLTGASTGVLAELSTGTVEATAIGVAVLVFVAGIAVFRHIRGVTK